MRTELGAGRCVAWAFVCALGCVVGAGCGGADNTSMMGRNAGSGSHPMAGSQAGAGNAGSAGTDFGNTPVGMVPVSEMQDAGASADAGCGATSVEAEQVVVEMEVTHEMIVETPKPIALYVMLDQSASMVLMWPDAVTAIKTFVDDMGSSGLDVALDVFPPLLGDVGECTGAGYDAPMVPLGTLPTNAMPIKDALDAIPLPTGVGTPTEGALRGVDKFCLDFEAAHPEEDCVAVLVTDGAPMGCAGDSATLEGIASSAFAAGVPTFAVGLDGADFTLLDAIATAGGAVDCDDQSPTFACDVSAGPAQLSSALAKIRAVVQTVETTTEIVTTIEETPVECEWAIPDPPAGMSFDREKVNVQLSSPTLTMPTPLGKVAGEDECKATGWYYDDPEDPTRVIACPEACELLQSTSQAKVDILLGCKTVVLL